MLTAKKTRLKDFQTISNGFESRFDTWDRKNINIINLNNQTTHGLPKWLGKKWNQNLSSIIGRFWNYRITFSLTSSSASTYSSSSWLLLSPLLTAFVGRSHASFMDLRPKNNKRVTAAYSPIGNAVWMTTERNFHVKNDW